MAEDREERSEGSTPPARRMSDNSLGPSAAEVIHTVIDSVGAVGGAAGAAAVGKEFLKQKGETARAKIRQAGQTDRARIAADQRKPSYDN